MLGKAVVQRLSQQFQVSYTVHQSGYLFKGAKAVACDLTAGDLALPAFDAVVHTAALTDVDLCQINPEEAYISNVLATRNLAAACPGAYFIYISTDFVFDGEKGLYRENDPASPISEYGRTKYLGEKEVPGSGCAIRTSIYGLLGNNKKPTFIERSLDGLRSGREIYGFEDQWFSPISIYNLAEILAEILEKRPEGILHLGGPERLSKYQFLHQLAASFGHPESLVKANSFAGHKFQAPRPRDASLDISKARAALNTGFCNAAESFECLKDKLK